MFLLLVGVGGVVIVVVSILFSLIDNRNLKICNFWGLVFGATHVVVDVGGWICGGGQASLRTPPPYPAAPLLNAS